MGGSAADGRASGTLQNATAIPYYGSLMLASGFSYQPRVMDVQAGGVHANALRGDGCVGFLDDRASISLDYTAGRQTLTVSATGTDDLNLVMRTPSGIYYCNDDATGSDPRIDLRSAESGTYQIWVGTWESTSRLRLAHVGLSENGEVVR